MKPLPWMLSLVVLLTSAAAAWANMAPHAFNTDPGFYQAYWAREAAAPLAFLVVGLTLLWLYLRPNQTNAYVVGVFLVLLIGSWVYWDGAFARKTSPDSFWLPVRLVDAPAPDPWPRSDGGYGGYYGYHAPQRVREVSADEARIISLLVSALVCFGGLAAFRRLSRPTSPVVHAPGLPSP